MKKIAIIILIGTLAIVGVYFVSRVQNTATTQIVPEGQPTDAPENESILSGEGKYVAYKDGILDTDTEGRRVLFFYASWCPLCRPVDAALKADTSSLPSDVRIIRVHYNDPETLESDKKIAQKYAITYQHTFVQIDSQGEEITRWNGGGIPEILQNIQ